MLEQAVKYIMYGFLIQIYPSSYFWPLLLCPCAELCRVSRWILQYRNLGVMYVYGFDLFFDFVGYSMFAFSTSNLMGIKSPINFDRPFKSRDLKEFWNRWHMSLSFWFRDFCLLCVS